MRDLYNPMRAFWWVEEGDDLIFIYYGKHELILATISLSGTLQTRESLRAIADHICELHNREIKTDET